MGTADIAFGKGVVASHVALQNGIQSCVFHVPCHQRKCQPGENVPRKYGNAVWTGNYTGLDLSASLRGGARILEGGAERAIGGQCALPLDPPLRHLSGVTFIRCNIHQVVHLSGGVCIRRSFPHHHHPVDWLGMPRSNLSCTAGADTGFSEGGGGG